MTIDKRTAPAQHIGRWLTLSAMATTLCLICVALSRPVPAVDCVGWSEPDFFEVAPLFAVQDCLETGFDPNARTTNGLTPLHMAAWGSKNPAVIVALVRAGAKVDARGVDNFEPLHLAAWGNPRHTVIAALIRAGADPNATVKGHMTPVHLAASFNYNPDIIAALVRGGADLNTRDIMGRTALHHALLDGKGGARRPNFRVDKLLELGADPNIGDLDDVAPLYLAAAYYDVRVAAALLRAGADPNARTHFGETALHAAVFSSRGFDIISVLVEAGADLEARDVSEWTPLHKAAFFGEAAPIIALLELGADIAARNGDGHVPWDLVEENSAIWGTTIHDQLDHARSN